MKQDEDEQRAETSEDTRRRIIHEAASPLRDDRHTASDGEALQLFE